MFVPVGAGQTGFRPDGIEDEPDPGGPGAAGRLRLQSQGALEKAVIKENPHRRAPAWSGGRRGGPVSGGGMIGDEDRTGSGQVPNSGRRVLSCDWSRWMIDECICETRDSLRSSVAPISFIVNSS